MKRVLENIIITPTQEAIRFRGFSLANIIYRNKNDESGEYICITIYETCLSKYIIELDYKDSDRVTFEIRAKEFKNLLEIKNYFYELNFIDENDNLDLQIIEFLYESGLELKENSNE